MSGNNIKKALKKLKLLIFTQKSEVAPFRKKIESAFSVHYLPNNIERTEKILSTVPCDMLTPVTFMKDRVIVYVHGGSFVGGSRESWRSFASSLAHACATPLVLPEIRLAPEYPFPSALDDLENVFAVLTKEYNEIILCGDSSGAMMALSFAIYAPKALREKISKLVLFSPILDLSLDAPLLKIKKISDGIMSAESLRRMANVYTFASNLSNSKVSPLCASEEELSALKNVYIQMGEDEILLPDARRLVNKLDYAHVPNKLDVWPGMMHFFQMADEYIAEAHKAIEKVATHIKTN